MTPAELKAHNLRLWRTCYNLSLAIGIFVKQKKAVTTKIQIFGRQLVSQQDSHTFSKEEETAWYIVMPNSKFKTFWNITVILLLLYTSTIVPFQVAFVDFDSDFSAFINYLVDILFAVDIFINFLSAYEHQDDSFNGLRGVFRVETKLNKIVKHYLTGWFLLDLIATFPTQIFLESDTNNSEVNKLARLARIPRLYRLFRVLRIFKIFKLFKYNKKFNQWFGYLNLGANTTKMLKLLLFGSFLIHLFSCLWYLTAKLNDFNDDVWVVRKGLVYDSTGRLYFESVYWSVQVLTTVGYGDFGAATTAEYIINLVWMLVGVGWYQIVFGQITSIITAHSSNAAMLDVSNLFQNQLTSFSPEQTQSS